MKLWLKSDIPTVVGDDFNVIPEDIDCHKPASWIHDAFFNLSRARAIERCLHSTIPTYFDLCILAKAANSPFGITSVTLSNTTVVFALTTSFYLRGRQTGY